MCWAVDGLEWVSYKNTCTQLGDDGHGSIAGKWRPSEALLREIGTVGITCSFSRLIIPPRGRHNLDTQICNTIKIPTSNLQDTNARTSEPTCRLGSSAKTISKHLFRGCCDSKLADILRELFKRCLNTHSSVPRSYECGVYILLKLGVTPKY